MAHKDLDLTTLEGLAEALEYADIHADDAHIGTYDGTFCPVCRDTRRMHLLKLYWENRWAPYKTRQFPRGELEFAASDDPAPAFYALVCVQCDASILVVVHPGPEGLRIVALPDTYAGLGTPNTPEPIAYYLDEAQRAQSIGARSAAIAMYRTALEHLLRDQGYEERMLGPKIQAFIEDPNPPAWRDRLDPAYLEAIKDLGNAALHTNDGTLEAQRVFEMGLLREVEALFVGLLDEVYERQARERGMLDRLRDAVTATREAPPPAQE